MVGLFLLASGLLFPLLALAFIGYTRENFPLMVRLLAGTGLICGVLTWLPYLGVLASVGTVVAPVGTGLSIYEIFVPLANMSSLIASALVAAAWILALYQAVRERSTRWISLLVVSGIIAYLARVIYQYSALVYLFGNSLYIPESLLPATGLYALTLLGGLSAFMYGARRASPGRLHESAQAALDDDEFSSITREPL